MIGNRSSSCLWSAITSNPSSVGLRCVFLDDGRRHPRPARAAMRRCEIGVPATANTPVCPIHLSSPPAHPGTNQETHMMISRNERKTITMRPDQEEPGEERVGQQKR